MLLLIIVDIWIFDVIQSLSEALSICFWLAHPFNPFFPHTLHPLLLKIISPFLFLAFAHFRLKKTLVILSYNAKHEFLLDRVSEGQQLKELFDWGILILGYLSVTRKGHQEANPYYFKLLLGDQLVNSYDDVEGIFLWI